MPRSSTETAAQPPRQLNRFTARITRDGEHGYPVEPGRYRLIWSGSCPWAHRAVIVRKLLGLEDAISLGTVDPIRDEKGWRFTLDDNGKDPVLGISYLADAYRATDQAFNGPFTVPAVIDTSTGMVATNDYPQITLDFSTEWKQFHRPDAPDLYPEKLRPEIDAVSEVILTDVNNGVYRCGSASSQSAYENAYHRLFNRLDWLEERLASQRYLVDGQLTEADIRLFTTLVRFDAVYHSEFRCNRNKLTEMPVLHAYARDLFQTPGFGDTVDFDSIKRHYYQQNPADIVPLGPDPDVWLEPHGRS